MEKQWIYKRDYIFNQRGLEIQVLFFLSNLYHRLQNYNNHCKSTARIGQFLPSKKRLMCSLKSRALLYQWTIYYAWT